MFKKKSIGELLIEYGKITRDDLEEGLRVQKEFNLRIGETLIRLGKITSDDIEWVLSKQLDIPFVIVENIALDTKLMSRFSEGLLTRNRILPLYETDDEIAIATDDPLNNDVFQSMEEFSGKKIKLSSGNGEKIREILTQFFRRKGIPALMSSIKKVLERLEGTSFCRIDFVTIENNTEINVFGMGILKKMEVLSESYTSEQVFESFESLGIGFLYEVHLNDTTMFLSVFPMLNRNENVSFPAVIGTFGLFIPEEFTFADMRSYHLPGFFQSQRPVCGYLFFSMKHSALITDKTVYIPDSAPEEFMSIYVSMPVPEVCSSCRGSGCRSCNELGYVFNRRLEGNYSPGEIKKIINGHRIWQK